MKKIKKISQIKKIGIVCEEGNKISPVATILFRDYAIKSSKAQIRTLQFWTGSISRSSKLTDSTIGYLQKRGFSNARYTEVDRISLDWIKKKDLILTSDKFVKRKILYDFGINQENLEESVYTLPEFAKIDLRIRDPGDEAYSDNESLFQSIDKCCKKSIILLEKLP